MVCVGITEAANEATCATLPLGSVAVEAEANERGKLGPDRRWAGARCQTAESAAINPRLDAVDRHSSAPCETR